MNPLVSVIVPVYNVEPYLNKCVESIVNQTYENLEIILVDDGSPDNCPKMCDEWAEKDSRIKVIHKQNGGLSDARNAALDIMKGSFVLFVDSDDYISRDAVEVLINIIINKNSDIVISLRTSVATEKSIIENKKTYSENTIDSITALETIMCDYKNWEAWSKLYKSKLFYNERFPSGMIYEDLDTIPRIVYSSNNVTFTNTQFYYYYLRQGSIMRSEKTIVKEDLFYAVNNNAALFDTIIDVKSRRNVKAGILEELASRVHLAYSNRKANEKFIIESRKLIFDNLFDIILSNKLSLKRKVFIVLVILNISKKIWRNNK